MDAVPAIEVKNLTKCYGSIKAIENISFHIKEGQIVGFLGPNGAGKSTTLRILAGLSSGSAGRAYIAGISVSACAKQVKRHIGYMPENNPLPDDMRVSEYLNFRAHLKQIPARRIRASVYEALERCDLHRTAQQKIIGNLSKGFRQRVGIADALLGKPKVIILDEPTIGLDPHQILGIRDLLRSLRDETTVLFSSHILPEVEAACSHLIILNKGQIVASDTPAKLRKTVFPNLHYKATLNCSPELLQGVLNDGHIKLILLHYTHDEGPFFTYFFETPCDSTMQPELISRWFFENQWEIKSFTQSQPTLETLFLQLTASPWKQAI